MRPLENAQENVRRLAENNQSINLPHLKECCETYARKSAHCRCDACGVEYCCQECQIQAYAAYHQSLCTRNDPNNNNQSIAILMDYWRQTHFPPETTTIYLILKIMALIKQVYLSVICLFIWN